MSDGFFLQADKMDEEAHTWITDWGPFVNPFISLFSFLMKPSLWTLDIVGLREPLAELGWRLYKNSVFYGLLSDQPGSDLVERSWASKNRYVGFFLILASSCLILYHFSFFLFDSLFSNILQCNTFHFMHTGQQFSAAWTSFLR